MLKEVKPGIYFVGAIDWDRRLFDEVIPLPDGTSYNAYLIEGSEKTALIDTVDPTKEEEFLLNLKKLGVKKIDYIVSNHAEQDHSGAIPAALKRYPEAKVVTNQRCASMLMDLLPVPEDKFLIVRDKETLSLGNKTLKFILAPWVHWPETMLTYLKEDKILFTCDFFGSHLATSNLYARDEAKVYESAKRYYAEIMMPFRINIKKNIEKIKDLKIDMIAPSHGPVYINPKFILNAYKDWVSDKVKNEVIIPYVSMHGSTGKMVHYLTDQLMEKGLTVKPYNLTNTDIGELAISLVDAATIVIASPTVLFGLHPSVLFATYLTNILKPKLKFAAVIGSYGWGGRIVDQLKATLNNLKVEFLGTVLVRGTPKKEDLEKLDELAEEIVKAHNELNLF